MIPSLTKCDFDKINLCSYTKSVVHIYGEITPNRQSLKHDLVNSV